MKKETILKNIKFFKKDVIGGYARSTINNFIVYAKIVLKEVIFLLTPAIIQRKFNIKHPHPQTQPPKPAKRPSVSTFDWIDDFFHPDEHQKKKTKFFKYYLKNPKHIINDKQIKYVNKKTYNLKQLIKHKTVGSEYLHTPGRLTAIHALLQSLYSFLKTTSIPVVIAVVFLYFSFVIFQISFLRFVSAWLLVLLFAFWLLSTFNFFLKRYSYGKFTSSLQRFWKRAFMVFWFNEGFLFSIYIYYLYIAPQEPAFMYDQAGFYKAHLMPWEPFLTSVSYVVIAVNLLTYLLIRLKVFSFRQTIPVLLLSSVILLIILLSESYQFYYLTNFYDDSFWVFSEESGAWELEHEVPRTRVKNDYFTIVMLAKFWHYIFIFGCWVFFVMKSLERARVRYTLLAFNVQNLIILYLMSWSLMYGWSKWFSCRFMSKTYYWFFTSNRPLALTSVASDASQLLFNALPSLFVESVHRVVHPFFYIKNTSIFTYSRDSIARHGFINFIYSPEF